MRVPQPFQYQGSKRSLASAILQYLPARSERIIEPFAGSAAISIACAARDRAKEFWLNDFNQSLAKLLELIINQPENLSEFYHSIWLGDTQKSLDHYYRIRKRFNRTQDPRLLLYLLARCVKGSIRYNSERRFNQSPDKRRLGTRPETMRKNIHAISMLMRGKSIVTSFDYRDVLVKARKSDVIYIDPPYQGVCGKRDARYFDGILFDDFVQALHCLNERGIRYLISYDGRLGNRSYGEPLPGYLNLTLVEIEAGRSSQATLLGRDEITFESLYLSQSLMDEVNMQSHTHHRNAFAQIRLSESPIKYDKISQSIS